MQTESLLAELTQLQITLDVEGDSLKVSGRKERLTPALIARLRADKPSLLAQLRGRAEAFGLSEMQRAYWVGRRPDLELGGVSSHVYHQYATAGLDPTRLGAALDRVVRRHDALRLAIDERGMQRVVPADALARPAFRHHDLRGEPECAARALIARLQAEMSHQVMPADQPPLVDARLVTLADGRQSLHLSHDGLAVDGISMQILLREWATFYRAPDADDGPLGFRYAQYVEAAEAQRTKPSYARARAQWLERIARGLPTYPQIPLRVEPRNLTKVIHRRHVARLHGDRTARLLHHARLHGLTATTAVLAAYCEVLARWGGGAHFGVNVTTASRLPIHPDVQRAIGNFTSSILLEVARAPESSFAARARAVQAQLRADLEVRQFSAIEVLRALAQQPGAPRTQRMPFTFNSTLDFLPDERDDAARLFGEEVCGVSQTPQVWMNAFVLREAGDLVVQVDAVDGLFPDGLVEDMVGALERLLVTLADDELAFHRVAFDLLPPAQAAVRRDVNATTEPVPAQLLHGPFFALAQRKPDRPAIATERDAWTYGRLQARADAIGAGVLAATTADRPLTAIVLPKGPTQIAALLGVLQVGGVYLPLDVRWPAARLKALLESAQVSVVLTTSGERPRLSSLGLSAPIVVVEELAESTCLPAPRRPLAQEDLAYVLYTSGSTGEPKAVCVTHRSAVNVVADVNRRLGIDEHDVFFGLSGCHFDLSVYDVFGALSTGASLVLPEPCAERAPERWCALAEARKVTVWNSVPTLLGMLAAECRATQRSLPKTLRHVLLSGDRIPPALVAEVQALARAARVQCLGGPTEATVWNVIHPITGPLPEGPIPYGRPLANSRCHVLDESLEHCPDHVSGEIYAAGEGLARGYLGDDERTRAQFFVHHGIGERLYRTGDRGRYQPDGTLEILGRADRQLKLSGVRVEPAEVEQAIASFDGAQGVVLGIQGDGRQVLVAYVAGLDPADEPRLRAHLASALPEAMVPARIEGIDALPLTANGKVDRAALLLRARDAARPADPGDRGLEGALEHAVAALLEEILRAPVTSAGQDFRALGGDSLTATRLTVAIRKRLGVTVRIAEIMANPTVRELSDVVAKKRAATATLERPLDS